MADRSPTPPHFLRNTARIRWDLANPAVSRKPYRLLLAAPLHGLYSLCQRDVELTMNPENLMELVQKSFRVTVGATTSLLETLQDPQKRQEVTSKLQSEWNQLADEWAEKGAITEQEARRFVDSFLARQRGGVSSNTTNNTTDSQPSEPIPTTAVPVSELSMPDVQAELQELTAQLAALREELESLKS